MGASPWYSFEKNAVMFRQAAAGIRYRIGPAARGHPVQFYACSLNVMGALR
jgi:hypothetical protein